MNYCDRRSETSVQQIIIHVHIKFDKRLEKILVELDTIVMGIISEGFPFTDDTFQ